MMLAWAEASVGAAKVADKIAALQAERERA